MSSPSPLHHFLTVLSTTAVAASYVECSERAINTASHPVYSISSFVRVVKEFDSKSNGLCPRRFESCRLRIFLFIFLYSFPYLSPTRNNGQLHFPSHESKCGAHWFASPCLVRRLRIRIMCIPCRQPAWPNG